MPNLHPSSVHSTPRRPERVALGICIAIGAPILGLAALTAAIFGVTALSLPGFALLALGGAVAGMLRWRRERHELDREAVADLEIARRRLEEGDPAGAGWVASKATTCATTPETRNAALVTLAWAALGQGYAERAKAALDRIEPGHALDVYCLAAVESARGETERAIDALEVARSARTLTCEGAKLLVDCCVRRYGIDRAVMAALQTREVLGVENCEKVVKAAFDAGAHDAAATLAAALGHDTRG